MIPKIWRHLAFALFLSISTSSAGLAAENAATRRDCDAFLAKAFALDMAPGMAIAIVKGEDVVYAKGFGWADVAAKRPVTPETQFYIASTTKSFTAFAAALLAHRGQIDLDAPIARYLPKLQLQAPLSADEITLRHLLTMTHGIEDGGPVVFRTAFTGVYTHDQLVQLLGSYRPAESGRAFHYGNLGYNIAGLAMDAQLGMSWKELLDREIFRPLGMKSTTASMSKTDRQRLALPYAAAPSGFEPIHYAKNDGNMHAAGGHVTTALDLARWIEVHLNRGRYDSRQVFPAEVVAETHRQQVEQDRKFGAIQRHGWGLGWDLGTYEGDTLVHRFGSFSGFRSHVSFMPERGLGVVVLVNNGTPGSFLADLAAWYAYDRLLEKPGVEAKFAALLEEYRGQVEGMRGKIAEDRARRAARSQALPHPLAAYAGAFENPELGRMEWTVANGALEVSMGAMQSSVEVYDAPANQLRIELTGSGDVVQFAFEGEQSTSLVWDGQMFTRVGR